MNVIDLFAGCGGFGLGFEMAGFNVALANEKDAPACETYRANHPNTLLIEGDIAAVTDLASLKLSNIDGIIGGPPCFPAGTPIRTISGTIPIEKCTPGTYALTHEGRFQRVSHRMVHQHIGDLCTIQTKYGRRPVVTTPEHPFWVRKRYAINKCKAYSPPSWVKASDIRSGDVVCEPHLKQATDLKTLPIITKHGSRYVPWHLRSRDCRINWQNLQIAWILGFYVAEGHTRGRNPTLDAKGKCRRSVIFSVATKEVPNLIERLNAAGFRPSSRPHSTGAARVTVTSLDFYALCQTVGKGASGKFIPEAFYQATLDWQREFLKGYFEGDGCTLKIGNSHSLKQKATTVSWELALGVARMISYVHKVVASIEILYPSGTSYIEGRKVNVKEAYSVGHIIGGFGRTRPGFVDEQGAWLPVKSVGRTKTNGLNVYNLEVEQDHSYVAGGFAVHNCQGMSISGERDPADPRNSLFIEFARFVAYFKPKFLVMENVPALLSMRTQTGLPIIDVIRDTFKEAGYKTQPQVLNAAQYGVPQTRERLFILGIREDFPVNPCSLFPRVRTGRSSYLTVMDAIGDLPVIEARQGTDPQAYQDPPRTDFQRWLREGSPLLHNHVAMRHSPRLVERFKHIAPGQGQEHVPDELAPIKRGGTEKSGTFYRQNNFRVYPDRPSFTIPAGFQTNFLHPVQHRAFTAREGARLQSFPDRYIFKGKRITMSWDVGLSQCEQIGNAVPPLLAKAIGESLRNYFVDGVVEQDEVDFFDLISGTL